MAPNDPDTARDRLLDAAEACFERSGISNTTVEDIAKQASVSRATVYRLSLIHISEPTRPY